MSMFNIYTPASKCRTMLRENQCFQGASIGGIWIHIAFVNVFVCGMDMDGCLYNAID